MFARQLLVAAPHLDLKPAGGCHLCSGGMGDGGRPLVVMIELLTTGCRGVSTSRLPSGPSLEGGGRGPGSLVQGTVHAW